MGTCYGAVRRAGGDGAGARLACLSPSPIAVGSGRINRFPGVYDQFSFCGVFWWWVPLVRFLFVLFCLLLLGCFLNFVFFFLMWVFVIIIISCCCCDLRLFIFGFVVGLFDGVWFLFFCIWGLLF